MITRVRFGPHWKAWGDEGADFRVLMVHTPLDETCYQCGEYFNEGESGEQMPRLWMQGETPPDPPFLWVHVECEMLGIVGHSFGVCNCTDYAGNPGDMRAAALELTRRIRNDKTGPDARPHP